MAAKVTVVIEGLEEVLSRLTEIEEKSSENLVKLTKDLANDTEKAWKEATPEGKTKQLRGGDKVELDGLSFTLENDVHYYPFVDEGHDTPRGWRTRHGYRIAKHRSHVAGREMTSKAEEFIEQNMTEYLSKFLDDV